MFLVLREIGEHGTMLAPRDLVFKAFYVNVGDLFNLLLIGSSDLKNPSRGREQCRVV